MTHTTFSPGCPVGTRRYGLERVGAASAAVVYDPSAGRRLKPPLGRALPSHGPGNDRRGERINLFSKGRDLHSSSSSGGRSAAFIRRPDSAQASTYSVGFARGGWAGERKIAPCGTSAAARRTARTAQQPGSAKPWRRALFSAAGPAVRSPCRGPDGREQVQTSRPAPARREARQVQHDGRTTARRKPGVRSRPRLSSQCIYHFTSRPGVDRVLRLQRLIVWRSSSSRSLGTMILMTTHFVALFAAALDAAALDPQLGAAARCRGGW